tara:strand:- start:1257 stop:1424 length:168 start_codon:yes stop_codon:yes gene_type:complete
MKKIIILIFFLTSCSTQIEENLFQKKFDFSNIKFEEFKLKLVEYSKKSSYPNIDN